MSERVRAEEPDSARWANTTWEGNDRWRSERAREATPEQLLAWLEETLELAFQVGALRAIPPRTKTSWEALEEAPRDL